MLLRIENLTVTVQTPQGEKTLVDHVDLNVEAQSIVGLVGGSGSGKTTTALSVLRLLSLQLKIVSGRILFDGKDLLTISETQMRSVRGSQIGVVFQDPLNSFNPVFRVGYQIEEVLKFHTSLITRQRQERVQELLRIVGIAEPARVYKSYPHQLSGGMRQRAMLAQAIAGGPKMIIADEPTSSLDVTLQARVIELFEKLRRDLGLTILLITHDLGVVRHLTDNVAIMNAGKIVEAGFTKDVLDHPKENYTYQLKEAAGF